MPALQNVPTTFTVNGEEMDISALPEDRRAAFLADYQATSEEIGRNMVDVRAGIADLQRRGLMDEQGNLTNPTVLE